MAIPSSVTPGAAPDAEDRLAGAPNFRSVAALPAADGRRLRSRRLFRSDMLARLTDADVDRLAALRIGTVLDLRRDDERAAAPSRWPDAARPDTLVFDTLPDLQAVRAGGWRERLADPAFDAEGARAWMLETYTRMPAALEPAVRAAFVRLAGTFAVGAPAVPGAPASAPAVLVHCTAGKDRTGFVCAMVLEALEIERDAILDDYLESSRRRPPAALARALVEWAGLPATPRTLDAVEMVASVRAEFLEASLRETERRHGSIAAYLRACGLDDATRDALRDAMLD